MNSFFRVLFQFPKEFLWLAVFLAHVKKLTHGKGYCNHMSQWRRHYRLCLGHCVHCVVSIFNYVSILLCFSSFWFWHTLCTIYQHIVYHICAVNLNDLVQKNCTKLLIAFILKRLESLVFFFLFFATCEASRVTQMKTSWLKRYPHSLLWISRILVCDCLIKPIPRKLYIYSSVYSLITLIVVGNHGVTVNGGQQVFFFFFFYRFPQLRCLVFIILSEVVM